MTQDIYVKVDSASLGLPTTRQGLRPHFGLRSLLGGYAQKRIVQEKVVLDDISFDLKKGDRLGLVGKNGAGKTTLLKLIGGVFRAQKGTVETSGDILSLVNMNLGFNQEATGIENIILRGIYLNQPVKEIVKKIPEIAEFSELEDHLNFPLYTFSAGMKARLSFSIMMAAEPEILLLDEWLGRGDAQFQKKAAAKIKAFVEKAGIVVLASHNQRLIEATCNRIIRLDQGKVISDEYTD